MPTPYRVRVIEKDLSGFVVQTSSEVGGMVVNSKRGPSVPQYCQSEEDVTLYFGAPDSTKWGVFEAIDYCKVAPGWIVSAIGTGAVYAGVDVRQGSVVPFGTDTGRNLSTFSYATAEIDPATHAVGTGNGITDTFASSLSFTPVKEGSLVLKSAGVNQSVTDASGTISGSALDSGSITYATGAYTLDFAGVAGTVASVTTDIDLSSNIDLSTGATAGIGEVSSVSVGFVGTTVPAVANATYDLDIAVNGVSRQVAFAVTTADTWNTIAAAIQAALRVLTSSTETVVITGGKIRATSVTTGSTSTIIITAGTAGSGGGDILAYIDANIAQMTTSINTPVDGVDVSKLAKITIDGVTVAVDFGYSAAKTQAQFISDINAAFTGTPAATSTNFITLTGTVGDLTNGQITVQDPDTGVTAVDLAFKTAGSPLTSLLDGTPSVSPTGSIPANGAAVTLDYIYTQDISTLVSHSFYAYSEYNDTDYQLAVKITYTTGTQYTLVLYEVTDVGNLEIETYTYSLTREKNLFGKSVYIEDVFNNNPYIQPVINTDYTGTTPAPTVATIAFTGGNRGATPLTSDYTTAWANFRKKNKYKVKNVMDIYGNSTTALVDLKDNYQPYAHYLTMTPMGSTAAAAITYRSGLGIDNDGLSLYWNWAKIEDIYNNSSAWVSQIGRVGVKYAQMEDVYDALAPAGVNENGHGGQLSGSQVYEFEYDPSENDKQLLDEAQINPIYFDDQYGPFIDGNKTMQVSNSDTSYIHTRRLYNLMIEDITTQILRKQVFKLNDSFHRLQAYQLTTEYLIPILTGQFLNDARVICDETNNTAAILNQRKFILDVVVQAAVSSEFVILRLTRVSQTQVVAEFIPR